MNHNLEVLIFLRLCRDPVVIRFGYLTFGYNLS